MNVAPCIQRSSHSPPSDPRCGPLTWAVPCARRSLPCAATFCQMIIKKRTKETGGFHAHLPLSVFIEPEQVHASLPPTQALFIFSHSPTTPPRSSICIHLRDSPSFLYPLIINLIFRTSKEWLCGIKEASTEGICLLLHSKMMLNQTWKALCSRKASQRGCFRDVK